MPNQDGPYDDLDKEEYEGRDPEQDRPPTREEWENGDRGLYNEEEREDR